MVSLKPPVSAMILVALLPPERPGEVLFEACKSLRIAVGQTNDSSSSMMMNFWRFHFGRVQIFFFSETELELGDYKGEAGLNCGVITIASISSPVLVASRLHRDLIGGPGSYFIW